ncbi:MAG: histidine phosphatase family protein [Trueperaceae bacterium]
MRHATAAERAPDGGPDADRPLVAKGEAQARRLAQALDAWGLRPDRVLASPWRRAAETARLLVGEPAAPLDLVDALAAPGAAAQSAAIAAAVAPADRVVVVVGHEPWMSELAAWSLTGRDDGLRIAYRKAAALVATGAPGPGGLVLEAFVPSRLLR